MTNYFLIEGQAHICLSLAIIQQEKLSNNHFIVSRLDLKPCIDILAKELAKNESINIQLHIVYEEMSEEKKYERGLIKARKKFKKKCKEVKKVLKRTSKSKSECSLFLFDDTTVTAKFLFHQRARRFKNFYFFDTSNFQDELTDASIKVNFKARMANKIKFGMWWRYVDIGTLVKYNKVYVLNDNVRSGDGLVKLEIPHIFSPLWQNFSVAVINAYFEEAFKLTEKSSILFLPLIRSQKALKEVSIEVLQKFGNSEGRVYIKNNPQSPVILKPKESRKNWVLVNENVPNESVLAMQDQIGARVFVPEYSHERDLLISKTPSYINQFMFGKIGL